MKLTGSFVALVTPLNQDLSLDVVALEKLIEWHIESGTQGLFIMGTTGEAASLSQSVYFETIRFAVEFSGARLPIYAGTTSNTADEVILLNKQVESIGVSGVLIAPPAYIKPPQRALVSLYQMIASSTELPIILYNVPGRNCVDLSIDTIKQLAAIDNIIGLKDATGELNRVLESKAQLPETFSLLSGDDETSLAFMKLGGDGVISVTGNIVPQQLSDMCRLAQKGDWLEAEQIDNRLRGLHVNLFVEANPIPVKWLLSDIQKIKQTIAPPLVELDSQYYECLRTAYRKASQ
jgi:4-hydroxy-tetrahydrodipicolinate synthase